MLLPWFGTLLLGRPLAAAEPAPAAVEASPVKDGAAAAPEDLSNAAPADLQDVAPRQFEIHDDLAPATPESDAVAEQPISPEAAPAQPALPAAEAAAEAPSDPQAAAPEQNRGAIAGQVIDSATGQPLPGVVVVLTFPTPEGVGEAKTSVATTDATGNFKLQDIPQSSYDLRFSKTGYRLSTLTQFNVVADIVNRVDFPLPPIATATADGSGEVMDLDAFVVEASTASSSMADIELRMDSDQALEVMSSEDLSKYASSDVASALQRVSGVNVVEGQFAVIRGLEDRYSSTTFNGAPVPSPDPDSQSVQLDLFPSEIVDGLSVSKTFSPNTPSNSSGGSIDIITLKYPEEVFQMKVKAKTGFNQNGWDNFLQFDSGSPIGDPTDGSDTLGREYGGWFGGSTKAIADRELRYKAAINYSTDFSSAVGFSESREPKTALMGRRGEVRESGDLSLGELSLTGGRFDETLSEAEEQTLAYGGLGFDLDREGKHKIDGAYFWINKREETVSSSTNGYFPGFDYSALADKQASGQGIFYDDFVNVAYTSWLLDVREDPSGFPSNGPLWYSSFAESKSLETDRDLKLAQINGDHTFERLGDLHFSWAANYAKTTQDEAAIGVRYFYEPSDTSLIPTQFPVTPEALGAGQYAATSDIYASYNLIDEEQFFYRADLDKEWAPTEWLKFKLDLGYWNEEATRNVNARFLEAASVGGSSQFAILADTPQDLGGNLLPSLDQSGGEPAGLRDTDSEALREIEAYYLGSKLTFWERFELQGGVRFEKIHIESNNDPFTGEFQDGIEKIYPSRYLFFDRYDNPLYSEVVRPVPAGTTFNDQLLGIDLPIDYSTTACDVAGEVRGCVDLRDSGVLQSLLNGVIDEELKLPSASVKYSPITGMNLRGAWSKTVARPSFREMGYYVSVEPATDDRVVGNPHLKLSHVESWDARFEYSWGEWGDLFALSYFTKTIEDPIESILIRDPSNLTPGSGGQFRTFFNNPSEGKLWGIEVEARKSLGFFGWDFLDYFSVGGNYTYINAEVERTAAEITRAQRYFGVAAGDKEKFSGYESTRRLFGQPEWIANADLTFKHPDWGTNVTLAWFAISNVLDAAGSVSMLPNGNVIAFTLDRYTDSYNQLDLILQQSLGHGISLSFQAKNLTDSERRVIYDPYQTSDEIVESSYRRGRDFRVQLQYEHQW